MLSPVLQKAKDFVTRSLPGPGVTRCRLQRLRKACELPCRAGLPHICRDGTEVARKSLVRRVVEEESPRCAMHEKPDETASFAAACLWIVLRIAASNMDLSRAGEVVAGPPQTVPRRVAPTAPFTLRYRSSRCSLPPSQICRRAGAWLRAVVGSSYFCQRADTDLPAISGL